MKRAVTVLLAFAALTVFSAPAQAVPPAHVKAVGQSRAEVVAYWTAARMRNAKPRELAKGNTARGKVTYPFTRYEPSPYPAMHGKVFFTDNGVNYVCSGTALNSNNKSVVWTAGHCVNEGPGDYFTNWAFVPAYKDGARPYGTWAAKTLLTTGSWRQSGDFGHDEGAAVVSANANGAALTTVVGGRGIAFDQPYELSYLAHGYPAAAPFTGGRMYICDSPYGRRDTSANPPTIGIGCDMNGGSSGGGWVVGGNVVSVTSYGYGNLKNVLFGPHQDSVAAQLYASASAG
jgi:V8-like Glu-specific endopeptidase